ncbi:MAG: tail assembly protein [Elioraea sp.]|nr:MAG: tail assembly protein [Elioraea sp.]
MREAPVTALRHPPPWCGEYVGIPFAERGRTREGCDCWGLVRLVLAERWRVRVPSCDLIYRDTEDVEAIATTFATAAARGWRRVSGPYWREGDVALFRVAGRPVHVGLIVGWPWMLHVERGIDAACDRIDGLRWARRLDSVWRHPELIP